MKGIVKAFIAVNSLNTLYLWEHAATTPKNCIYQLVFSSNWICAGSFHSVAIERLQYSCDAESIRVTI